MSYFCERKERQATKYDLPSSILVAGGGFEGDNGVGKVLSLSSDCHCNQAQDKNPYCWANRIIS